MKYILFCTFLMLGLSATAQKNSTDSIVNYSVSMTCMRCKQKIEKNIPFEKGVKALQVNLEEKTVTVRFNKSKSSSNTIRKAIEKLDYDVDINWIKLYKKN